MLSVMPSTEASEMTTVTEVQVNQVHEVGQTHLVDHAAKMAQVAEVIARSSPARINHNPKRKPDKSKIFRIRASDLDDPLVCPNCRSEFGSMEALQDHRENCVHESPMVVPIPENQSSPDRSDDLRTHQDLANNNQAALHILKQRAQQEANSDSRESSVDRNNGYDSDSNQPENPALAHIRKLLAQQHQNNGDSNPQEPTVGPIAQQLAQSNMALEAIQNTRMALAQFATNALSSGNNNPQSMQEFAMLQGTLYTLQQQQVMQLNLIQQLQAQLTLKKKEGSPDKASDDDEESKIEETKQGSPKSMSPRPMSPRPLSPRPMSPNTPLSLPPQQTPFNEPSPVSSSSFISSLMERFKMPPKSNEVDRSTPLTPIGASANGSAVLPPDRPISPPMTASSIASSVIQHTDLPPPDEPNTLEMLQRTANQVLNSASQGLLTNRLIDDHKPNDKDPYYKHRCRYCGKVFGSDSALQIHIRSHTGERPFKCNICGNRFTTKGNLKVHFQRHQQRFPHVKMNITPIPEHLDKFHPPLLAQLGEMKDYPPPPNGPPNPFSSLPPTGPTPTGLSPAGLSPAGLSPAGFPPYRLPGPPPLDLHRPFNLLKLARNSIDDKDEPENLSLSEGRLSPGHHEPDFIDRSREHSLEVDGLSRHSDYEPKLERRNDILEYGEIIERRDDSDRNYSSDREMSVDRHYDPASMLEQELRMGSPGREVNTDCIENEDGHIKDEIQDDQEHSVSADREIEPEQQLIEHEHELSVERQDDIIEDREISSEREQLSAERDHSGDEPSPLDIRIRSVLDLKETMESNLERLKDDNNESRSPFDQPTDLRIPRDFRPLGLPGLPFGGHRLPFPFLPGLPPTSMGGPMGPLGPLGPPGPPPVHIPAGVDPSKDPTIYTNLLPRPGSTDNSWEALIEVQKASETMKLEQLVNNIENKITDPNQCIICHRVLSCKSALQMHYRTHTGERPFKCKICGRAFTTKGNLKTHMGVHRAKPPMRMLHQCPVCHKKYTNGLVLQQHIRQHTGEPTDLTAEQISAAEIRDFPPMNLPGSLPGLLPAGFPLPPHMMGGFPPLPLHLRYQLSPDAIRRSEDRDDNHNEEEKYLRPFSTSSRSSSTGSAEQRTAEDLTIRSKEDSFNGLTSPRSPRRSVSPTPSDYSDLGDRPHDDRDEIHVSPAADRGISGSVSPAVSSNSHEERTSSVPLDLASRSHPPLFSPFGLFPPPLTSAGTIPGTPSLSGMNPLFMQNMPVRPPPHGRGLLPYSHPLPPTPFLPNDSSKDITNNRLMIPEHLHQQLLYGRGNTTCHICFKVFACQSALEIHIRSHTKERPYKCNHCDRGFSTKQHMLTHKIRDCTVPQDISKSPSSSNGPTGLDGPIPSMQALSASMSTPSLSPLISSPLQAMSSMASPLRAMSSPLQALSSPLQAVTSPFTSISSPLPSSASIAALLNQARSEEDKFGQEPGVKRELEGDKGMPVPKRPSGVAEEELIESSIDHHGTLTPNPAPSPAPVPEMKPLLT